MSEAKVHTFNVYPGEFVSLVYHEKEVKDAWLEGFRDGNNRDNSIEVAWYKSSTYAALKRLGG